MNSVIQEIKKLRGTDSIDIMEHLSNRYMIICREPDRTKTAYCFSVPIRNSRSNNTFDLRFCHNKYGSSFLGSDAKITVSDKVTLANSHGRCDIIFQGSVSRKTKEAIYINYNNGQMEIRPTLNGLFIILDKGAPGLTLRLDKPYETTRSNDKYFSVMREKFIPLVTVSCIGTINISGKITAPCEIHNHKVSEKEYTLTFSAASKAKSRIALEINMQQTKLFQDTTVESKHPKLNNAFGGMSFLGETKSYGEQWLYSRLQTTNISQLQSKKILNTTLHIPQIGRYTAPITVNRISTRFCSFGSNWENKIAISDPVSESTASHGYYHLDMTKLLGNLSKKAENFVIRGKYPEKPVVIPTGDNFYAPQILEVKYQ